MFAAQQFANMGVQFIDSENFDEPPQSKFQERALESPTSLNSRAGPASSSQIQRENNGSQPTISASSGGSEGYTGPRTFPVLGDVVALLVDIPWQNVWRGQVGKVVDLTVAPTYTATSDSHSLAMRPQRKVGVEFRDSSSGLSFQLLMIPSDDVMVLHQQQHPDW